MQRTHLFLPSIVLVLIDPAQCNLRLLMVPELEEPTTSQSLRKVPWYDGRCEERERASRTATDRMLLLRIAQRCRQVAD